MAHHPKLRARSLGHRLSSTPRPRRGGARADGVLDPVGQVAADMAPRQEEVAPGGAASGRRAVSAGVASAAARRDGATRQAGSASERPVTAATARQQSAASFSRGASSRVAGVLDCDRDSIGLDEQPVERTVERAERRRGGRRGPRRRNGWSAPREERFRRRRSRRERRRRRPGRRQNRRVVRPEIDPVVLEFEARDAIRIEPEAGEPPPEAERRPVPRRGSAPAARQRRARTRGSASGSCRPAAAGLDDLAKHGAEQPRRSRLGRAVERGERQRPPQPLHRRRLWARRSQPSPRAGADRRRRALQ